MYRRQGLDDSTLRAWQAWLAQQLERSPLTRDELRRRLPGGEFRFDGMTLGFALMWAELEMVIASGPPQGLTHTYQLLEPAPPPDREDSIRWLVETFLTSHGPSSVADVCAWSGLTVSDVRHALAELGRSVSTGQVLGTVRHWIGSLDDRGWGDLPTVELLNGYDEYISGLHARSKSHLDPRQLYRQRPGTPVAVLMIDGALAGHWRRTTSARAVRIALQPLRALSTLEQGALAEAVERYARFSGLPATVESGSL